MLKRLDGRLIALPKLLSHELSRNKAYAFRDKCERQTALSGNLTEESQVGR
jgi:hypothetical protein